MAKTTKKVAKNTKVTKKTNIKTKVQEPKAIGQISITLLDNDTLKFTTSEDLGKTVFLLESMKHNILSEN